MNKRQLIGLINELIDNRLGFKYLNEMAYSLDAYRMRCVSLNHQILKHVLKIIAFEDVSPSTVSHWRNELYNMVSDLIDGELKKGIRKDKSCYFKEMVVDTLLGEKYEEYYEREKLLKSIIKDYANRPKPDTLVEKRKPSYILEINRDRVIRLYNGLIRCSEGSGDFELLNNVLDEFINDTHF